MKRYLLFAYNSYESLGGWRDFVDSFDSIQAAYAFYLSDDPGVDGDNGQIVDLQIGRIVWTNNLSSSNHHDWPEFDPSVEVEP